MFDQLTAHAESTILIALIVMAAGVMLGAFALLWLVWELKRVVGSRSRHKLYRLRAQTAANEALLEQPEGRRALLQFMTSEAALMEFLDDFETGFREADNDELTQYMEFKIDEPLSIREKAGRWFKRNKKAIAEKIFDKANDLVKSFIPGAEK